MVDDARVPLRAGRVAIHPGARGATWGPAQRKIARMSPGPSGRGTMTTIALLTFLRKILSLAPPNVNTPTCVRSPNRIAHPLSNAPVLNCWFRCRRRLSLPAMRPRQAQAVSSVGPTSELPKQARAGKINWLHILLAVAGITLFGSVAGVVVYDWYFDSVLVGLSSSLQPISDAFHQLGGSHVRQSSPPPVN